MRGVEVDRVSESRQTRKIASPFNHSRFLHDDAKGCFTIATKNPDFTQRTISCNKLDEELPAYGGENDVYISQNTFRGPRSEANLLQLRALYSDVDYYKLPDLKDMPPRGVLDLALEDLERAKIPRPSIAFDTGRGLALVWRHEPAPMGALWRWKPCQKLIFEALQHLGADPAAKDVPRLLRLAGSYNSKSETLVHSIWETDEVWDFDSLADDILPYTRQEIEDLRVQHAAEKAQRDARKPSKVQREVRQGLLPLPTEEPTRSV